MTFQFNTCIAALNSSSCMWLWSVVPWIPGFSKGITFICCFIHGVLTACACHLRALVNIQIACWSQEPCLRMLSGCICKSIWFYIKMLKALQVTFMLDCKKLLLDSCWLQSTFFRRVIDNKLLRSHMSDNCNPGRHRIWPLTSYWILCQTPFDRQRKSRPMTTQETLQAQSHKT